MSDYQQKDFTGVLFKNEGDRLKQDGPLYSGNATINGVEHWMDAWVKKSAAGKTFMSFRFKVKQQRQESAPVNARRAAAQSFREDEPPF